MNRLVRALIVLAVAIVVTGRSPGAWACSCAIPASPDGYMETATYAFEGVMYNRDDPDGDGPVVSSARTVTWSFDVEKELKGDLARRIEVDTSADGASCGYSFRLGNRYRVYLYEGPDGRYNTGLCSGNEDLGPSGRQITRETPPPRRHTPTATATPTPTRTRTASPMSTPTPSRSIDGVAAGAQTDSGGGSGGFVAGFALLTLGTTVGALIFARRRRST